MPLGRRKRVCKSVFNYFRLILTICFIFNKHSKTVKATTSENERFYFCGPKSISLFVLLFWEFVVLLIVPAFNTQSTVIIISNY